MGIQSDRPAIDRETPQPSPSVSATRRDQAWGPGDDVPRPLLRQSMTIVPPWDHGSDATLQVIVLADADDTANRFAPPSWPRPGGGATD
jgi:hypothetical protein